MYDTFTRVKSPQGRQLYLSSGGCCSGSIREGEDHTKNKGATRLLHHHTPTSLPYARGKLYTQQFARQSQRVASGSQDNATPASPAPANQPQSPPPQGANAQGDNIPWRKRRLQHVLTNTQSFKIVRWMIVDAEFNTLEGLCVLTVRHFPTLFKGRHECQYYAASRYWRDRLNIMSAHERHSKNNGYTFMRPTLREIKKHSCWAKSGRGRKQAP